MFNSLTPSDKNEDLNNEISILKELLREEEAKRGKISEERDSYKTALQVLTKELNIAESNSPSSTHDQPDDNYVEQEKNRGPNSRTKKTQQGKGQKSDSQAPMTGQNRSTKDLRSTFIAGDSIVKHLNGRSMSGPNSKVQVSSFSGCTTSDVADYIRPKLRRKPDSIIIHVETNSL